MTTAQANIEFKEKIKALYEDREADNITDWVFENVTGLKKWERKNKQHDELPDIHLIQLKKYLDELLQWKPVQYVLNEAWFYKRKFYVNENVLIPRPETEELVEWVIHDLNGKGINKIHLIDIGTGSGCIPVSLKKELPALSVTAIDISENAIAVAQKNAAALKAEINFLSLDFLRESEWQSLEQYDIIISNPPYIPKREKGILAKNVIDYEPDIALFIEDGDPFIFYKKIAVFAQSHLQKNGKIYVEVHEEYAKNVKSIFENASFISIIKKDIYGKERMVSAE